ncbi:hypothetical protein GOP47_0010075 [Adiantum capillus-veneris]|uniref:B box-type domain-containing protein n=1 Tax=Adiantum capillus-veneris TaxID=13818 RepID=A0A9D4UUL1_ADICA|nr:hypothetical protein GOP47_0010075 [Adiantum capillus-veneris]
MKLLCSVCENAKASIICYSNQEALCSSCNRRVHAARDQLVDCHQHAPLLFDETSERATCDICQEKPSFFFCIEDRALLCRECDDSVHSASALAAKHMRFLLTGIQVQGMSPMSGSPYCRQGKSPAKQSDLVSKKVEPVHGVVATEATTDCRHENHECCNERSASGGKLPSSDSKSSRGKRSAALISSALGAVDPRNGAAKSLRSLYTLTKDGTLISLSSNTNHVTPYKDSECRKEPAAASIAETKLHEPNTTISIWRISATGQLRAPFVAPVLSFIQSSRTGSTLMRSSSSNESSSNDSSYSVIKMPVAVDDVPDDSNMSTSAGADLLPESKGSRIMIGEHDSNMSTTAGADLWPASKGSGIMIGEHNRGPALQDKGLFRVCQYHDVCGQSSSDPIEEGDASIFGLQIEEQPWALELDFMDEHKLYHSEENAFEFDHEMCTFPTGAFKWV